MEAIKFPENVEVGKVYLVPHVRLDKGTAYSTDDKGSFVPVNTHLHEDKKVLNFPYKHWHIDWRFVNDRLWKLHIKGGQEWPPASEGKLEVGNIIIFEDEALQPGTLGRKLTNSTIDSNIYYLRRKCRRVYMAPEVFKYDLPRVKPDSWLIRLPKVFCNAQLKQVSDILICPHKGAHIDKNCKDADGNYVCPAHLLRFDPITLKVVQ